MRQFLARGTGCLFASAFAKSKDGPILWVELNIPEAIDDLHATAIEDGFQQAASRRHAVGLVFPTARDEGDLIQLVTVLHRLPRWSIQELGATLRPPGLPENAGVFAALWQTEGGAQASVMVLGPFGWLPVHRRAPYLTVMSWTGTRLNDLLKPALAHREGPVGFIDMPIGDAYRTKYDEMWTKSGENAKRMRKHEGVGINAAARAGVAFSVSPRAAERIRAAISG